MPTYAYDCADCGTHFEVTASMGAAAEKRRCPGCGSERVRRDYGGIAILHRGGRSGGAGSNDGPRPGELRVADPRRLTTNVATDYANKTGDRVMREVARRADSGAEPDRLQEFVREVKDDRRAASKKRGVQG